MYWFIPCSASENHFFLYKFLLGYYILITLQVVVTCRVKIKLN